MEFRFLGIIWSFKPLLCVIYYIHFLLLAFFGLWFVDALIDGYGFWWKCLYVFGAIVTAMTAPYLIDYFDMR